jgi:hypothetical protein
MIAEIININTSLAIPKDFPFVGFLSNMVGA